ncbi:MAG: histidine--tRNA ligase [Parcubacteria group bacterium Licking1014_1]|nr:MAG: histidine--tRNA ligase [Parcubacteria group bacterium Licking1014_1]
MGMRDILPEDQARFQKVQKSIENIANYYGFQKIDTPILERAEVFLRGIGANTDMAEKEIYSFRTKSSDFVALRPGYRPAIARSYIEHKMHSLPQPVKLWYHGPCFRHGKSQPGRYRQFYQFGFEAIGEKKSSIDGQIIQMSYDVLKDLGFKNLTIEVNSVGDSGCRPYFKKILTSNFRSKKSSLCPDCQRRLKENPMGILDCKEEKCQGVKASAPQIIDHLCETCHAHFKQVLEFLDELELPYVLNPCLVRGLDCYTKTVFGITENSENGKIQGTLMAGGRYDGLVKILGGRDAPACGVSGGTERIINLMRGEGKKLSKNQKEAEIFLVQLGQLAKRKSLKLFEEFRKAKIPIAESFSKDSLKDQLRVANKLEIRHVLIFGQKEALENFIILRDMKTGVQKEIKLDKVVKEMKNKIKRT